MKMHQQFAFGVGIGVAAAYVFNVLKAKGLLPGLPKHAA